MIGNLRSISFGRGMFARDGELRSDRRHCRVCLGPLECVRVQPECTPKVCILLGVIDNDRNDVAGQYNKSGKKRSHLFLQHQKFGIGFETTAE